MTIWFTSDTHFGHSNIIKHCKRPWIDSISMDADLIKRYNAIVSPEDEVWHLGDFSFHRANWKLDADIIDQLNGKKNLILGNHDTYEIAKKCNWNSIHNGIVKKTFKTSEQEVRIVMCHFPLREWDAFYYGAFHLFGHTHNLVSGYCRSMDVGVDTNDYIPYSLEQVVSKLLPLENKHSLENKNDIVH